MNTDTPRTDRWEYDQQCNFDVPWEDHCRTLERELGEAKQHEDEWKSVGLLIAERDQLRAENEALANLLWEHPSAPCDQDSVFESMKRVKELRSEVEKLKQSSK